MEFLSQTLRLEKNGSIAIGMKICECDFHNLYQGAWKRYEGGRRICPI